MSLFDEFKLPDNERAVEILERISELWEENAWIKPESPSLLAPCYAQTYHEEISLEVQEMLITLSQTVPQELEDMLNEEAPLHRILRFAEKTLRSEEE